MPVFLFGANKLSPFSCSIVPKWSHFLFGFSREFVRFAICSVGAAFTKDIPELPGETPSLLGVHWFCRVACVFLTVCAVFSLRGREADNPSIQVSYKLGYKLGYPCYGSTGCTTRNYPSIQVCMKSSRVREGVCTQKDRGYIVTYIQEVFS